MTKIRISTTQAVPEFPFQAKNRASQGRILYEVAGFYWLLIRLPSIFGSMEYIRSPK